LLEYLLAELALAQQAQVALTTQTCGMTIMITGLAVVAVVQVTPDQDHFQTEQRFRRSQVIQVLQL
jgi:hypothetical protein